MDKNTIAHSRERNQPPHDAAVYHPADAPNGVAQDASAEDLHQALRQAQANLLRYQELFDFAPDGYLVTDSKGVIHEANPAATAMLGTPKPFLLGKPLLFYVAEGDRWTFLERLHELGRHQESRLRWELTLCPPRDRPFYAMITALATWTQGPDTSIRWVIRDTAYRRQIEEVLQAERGFSDSLLELAEAVVLVLDSHGWILRTNQYVVALTGYGWDELVGRPLADLVVPEDWPALWRSLGQVTGGGPRTRGVHRLRTRNGQTRTLAWAARLLTTRPHRGPCLLLAGNDITELQDAQRRAIQAERLAAIGQMITGLAHESRNALQRIQSCLTILSYRLQGHPEALDLIDRTQRAQDDLHKLFEEVRAFAAPLRLEVRSCDLAEVWRVAWQDLSAIWAQRDAELREELRVTDLSCEASSFHLKQVFRNLLENALSMITGPVRITIRCTAAEVDGRAALQVAVEDNGPGFSA